MSAEYFLDTSVLVYSFDKRSPEKQRIAQDLVGTALQERSGVISWQVVQEFLNVARHKFQSPLSLEESRAYYDQVLRPLCAIHPDFAIYARALSVQLETQYRYYDSLIVAAAECAGCSTLYSEGLQAGRSIGNLTIVNPFA